MTDLNADEALLHTLQQEAFAYFLQNINPGNGLPWRLNRSIPCIQHGLRRAGFQGGWL